MAKNFVVEGKAQWRLLPITAISSGDLGTEVGDIFAGGTDRYSTG
ncbi:hypothetical protein O5282_18455 [Escherichia coli]|nr:hypothetical protein [Escherichia coli]